MLVEVHHWLVVWNIFYFSIYWESSSQLTVIFFRGVETTNQINSMKIIKKCARKNRFLELDWGNVDHRLEATEIHCPGQDPWFGTAMHLHHYLSQSESISSMSIYISLCIPNQNLYHHYLSMSGRQIFNYGPLSTSRVRSVRTCQGLWLGSFGNPSHVAGQNVGPNSAW